MPLKLYLVCLSK